MNQRERGELERIAQNETLLEAIKKIVLESMEMPANLDKLDDKQIGERVRAYQTAEKAMELAIINIKHIKKEPKGKTFNPAR